MAYIDKFLEPGESIILRARTGFLSYIGATLIFILLLWPFRLTRLASTELVLTDKRILGRKGMFWQDWVDMPFDQIRAVTVRQALLDRGYDYGTVVISGKDGSSLAFESRQHPRAFKRKVDEMVEMAVLGHRLDDYNPSTSFIE